MKKITGSLSFVLTSLGVLVWWWASPEADYYLTKKELS